MVCSSSDSEGRSLKVLSSRPGASREKRRTRWGRGVAASGSAVLAGLQHWWGSVESVTTGFSETQPLFWFASASLRPARETTRVIYGLGPAWHTTNPEQHNGFFWWEQGLPTAAKTNRANTIYMLAAMKPTSELEKVWMGLRGSYHIVGSTCVL